ncbi:MAG: chemotaxis protein CheB [Verrucomicrobiota bacterium]
MQDSPNRFGDRETAKGIEAVVLGASAGAIEALSVLLPSLPASYPLPLMIVVHVPADASSAIAELFAAKCSIRVKEAEDKEPICGGTVYFAPADYHLLVEPTRLPVAFR